MYGEEADLCLRAKGLGFRPMASSVATIIHYCGASENIRTDKLVRLLSAKMRLVKYHFPAYSRHLGYWLFSLWPVRRYLVQAMVDRFVGQIIVGKSAVWLDVEVRRNEW